MKTPALHLVAILIAVYSCAPSEKQQQETPTTEQTPVETTSDTTRPIALTPEVIESINRQLFLWLHGTQMPDGSKTLAIAEEFNTNGAEFEYRLIRDNMDKAGWNNGNDSEDGIETTDNENNEEDRPYAQGQNPQYAQVNTLYFLNQVDTIIARGTYKAFATQRYLVLNLTGTIVHVNAPELDGAHSRVESYGPSSEELSQISLPPGDAVFDRGNLYLKAKITPLTDADLAGMSKDDLGYLRNEIFARHGHTFKTPKMKKYFDQKDWYQANIDDATSLLNKFEKQNVEFIKSKEG